MSRGDAAVVIRAVTAADAAAITPLYNHYILNTAVTFEEVAVETRDMAARIEETRAAGLPWLVAVDEAGLAGYACAGRWKGRSAYRYSVECSIYLAPGRSGAGLGTRLYAALFEALRSAGTHVAIGGIALPNPGSVALHEKFGMTKVAHFAEVGRKFERWVDVGYWQIVFRDSCDAHPAC